MIRTDIPHGLPPRRAGTPCTKKPIHIPRTRACVVWAERSEAHKGAGRRLRRGEAKRSPARAGKRGMREARADEKRGGASATNGSTNPGGLSVSAIGRAWAAGAREKGCRAFRRNGSSRKAPGWRREPPPISEERPNDSTDTYQPAGGRRALDAHGRPIQSALPDRASRVETEGGLGEPQRLHAAWATPRMAWVGRGAKGRGGREPSNGKRPQIGWVEYVLQTICRSGLVL